MRNFSLYVGVDLNPWHWGLRHIYLIGEGWATIWEWKFIFITFSFSYSKPKAARDE